MECLLAEWFLNDGQHWLPPVCFKRTYTHLYTANTFMHCLTSVPVSVHLPSSPPLCSYALMHFWKAPLVQRLDLLLCEEDVFYLSHTWARAQKQQKCHRHTVYTDAPFAFHTHIMMGTFHRLFSIVIFILRKYIFYPLHLNLTLLETFKHLYILRLFSVLSIYFLVRACVIWPYNESQLGTVVFLFLWTCIVG